MAISSEIEKLERRWNENPSGLMFAPLAEAYRKAGNHAHALDLLEHGLRVHPDYVPALIVRARCHLETGGAEAAEAAFDQVLTRDPVNAIALRGLADVYERSGRVREAAERLELLLEVDRGDTDAREALERLRLQASVAEAASPSFQAPSDAVAETAPVEVAEPVGPEPEADALVVQPDATLDLTLEVPAAHVAGLEVENLSIDPMESEAADQAPFAGRLPWEPVAEAKSLWGEIEIAPERAPEPGAAEAVAAEPSAPEPAAPELVATDTTAPDALMAEPAPEPEVVASASEVALPPVAWSPSPGPVLWTPAPVAELAPEPPEAGMPPLLETELELAEPAPASEPPAMEIQDSGVEPAPPESPEAAAVPWPTIEAPTDSMREAAVAEPAPELEAEPEFELEPQLVAEAEPAPEPEPVHEATAEAPEPAPAMESTPVPADESGLIVTESMAEVFLRQGHKSLALAVYRQLAERTPGSTSIMEAIAGLEADLAPVPTATEPVRVAYRAAETGGRSVGQLLRAVLTAPPPVATSTVLPPAIEPAGEPTRPTPQALTLGAVFGDEPAAAPPAVEQPAATEPSYDEFFGAAPAAEVGATGAARGPDGEDLRQFNDWLRGLKR